MRLFELNQNQIRKKYLKTTHQLGARISPGKYHLSQFVYEILKIQGRAPVNQTKIRKIQCPSLANQTEIIQIQGPSP